MSELDQQRSTWLENLHPGKHPFRTLEGRGVGTTLPQLIPFGHQTLCGDDVSQHACAYGRLWVQQSTSVNSSGWLISDLAACSYSATYFSIILSDEKRLSASRLHKALSISLAAEMASAISATLFTRKPVRPCGTSSFRAPFRYAITGVPQAIASIATSELVSGTRLGIKRHFAPARRDRFLPLPTVPRKRWPYFNRGRISCSKYAWCTGYG